MSQNTRNQPSESQGNSGRLSNANRDRNRYEGFEGMNYEQVRQPYNQQQHNNDREDINGSNGMRRDEL